MKTLYTNNPIDVFLDVGGQTVVVVDADTGEAYMGILNIRHCVYGFCDILINLECVARIRV